MSTATATPGIQGKPRVLVVDDEPRLCEMLIRAVEEMGLTCSAVGSASQARKTMDRERFDILVLDLNLPGTDGMEFLEKLRGADVMMPVIILTGFGNLEAARKAIRLDAVDFLTKPCALRDLEVALSRAVRQLRSVLPEVLDDTPPRPSMPAPAADDSRPQTLAELERAHIFAALERHNGNRAAAAAELGISERTLYYRLGEYEKRGESPGRT
jgi:DNA-binding NtrC family response regulator